MNNQAYHYVYHYTLADGQLISCHDTNDDDDDGFPDAEVVKWTIGPQPKNLALQSPYDRSHIGCSGVHVYVYLDGKELT